MNVFIFCKTKFFYLAIQHFFKLKIFIEINDALVNHHMEYGDDKSPYRLPYKSEI